MTLTIHCRRFIETKMINMTEAQWLLLDFTSLSLPQLFQPMMSNLFRSGVKFWGSFNNCNVKRNHTKPRKLIKDFLGLQMTKLNSFTLSQRIEWPQLYLSRLHLSTELCGGIYSAAPHSLLMSDVCNECLDRSDTRPEQPGRPGRGRTGSWAPMLSALRDLTCSQHFHTASHTFSDAHVSFCERPFASSPNNTPGTQQCARPLLLSQNWGRMRSIKFILIRRTRN